MGRNTPYQRGDPHVNLCLAVLGEAERGATLMWQEFKATHDMGKFNQNAFEVAQWVGNWWADDMAGRNATV